MIETRVNVSYNSLKFSVLHILLLIILHKANLNTKDVFKNGSEKNIINNKNKLVSIWKIVNNEVVPI